MARPRIFDDEKPPHLNIKVSPALYDRVVAAAKAAGHEDISPFVRDLLARVLSHQTRPASPLSRQ